MTTYTKKVWKLRTSVSLIGLIFILGMLAPVALIATDAFAAPDAPDAQVTVTVPASAPTVAATKVAPKPDAPTAVAPAPVTPVSGDTQSWWQALLVPVLSVFGMFIAAFLTAGLRKLVKLIEAKWNIDMPDSVEKLMTEKARWALAWVEEKAEKRLLHGDGQKTSGADKISEVVDLLQKFADGIGYGHDWQKDKIEGLAEGVLHLERDKTIGSTGDRAKKIEEKKNGNA